MNYRRTLNNLRRNVRFKDILDKIDLNDGSVRNAFRRATDRVKENRRINETLNTDRLLESLRKKIDTENVTTRDLADLGRRLLQRDVKSLNRTLADLEAMNRARLRRDYIRYRDGYDGIAEYTRNFLATKRQAIGLGTLLGEFASGISGAFERNFKDVLRRAIDKGRSFLNRLRDNKDKDFEKQVQREADETFTAAERINRLETEEAIESALLADGGQFVDKATRDKLYEPDKNYDSLMESFGQITVERRIDLKDESECVDCLRFAALGWQLVNVLPDIGNESRCRDRCRCRFDRSRLDRIPRADALELLKDIRRRYSTQRNMKKYGNKNLWIEIDRKPKKPKNEKPIKARNNVGKEPVDLTKKRKRSDKDGDRFKGTSENGEDGTIFF